MGSYGKSFRGLIISRICYKFSGIGVAENYGTVEKFHKNIIFFLKIVSYRISRKVIPKKTQENKNKKKVNKSTSMILLPITMLSISLLILSFNRRICARAFSLRVASVFDMNRPLLFARKDIFYILF